MTDTISDEARELARKMAQHFTGVDTGTCGECLQLAQSALTAARQEAAREMRERCEPHIRTAYEAGWLHSKRAGDNSERDCWEYDKDILLTAIRALPVEG